MDGILLAVSIIFIYIFIAMFLATRYKNGLKRLSISFWGPILMWRTVRGKKLIDKLATCKRFWTFYANIGLVLLFFIMFMMVVLLIVAAYTITTRTVEPMPPENVLVLPGINPIIPLWYGIFALIIAVVIHEFAHGILARVANIKLKSLGAILFVIPLGAFVEPDENKLRSIKKIKRDRVFAAGPATNIFFALLCAMIFAWGFMGSLEPVEEGVIVIEVTEDYPAEQSGLKVGMIIVYIEGYTTNGTILPGTEITTKEDFSDFLEVTSVNDIVNVTVYDDGEYIVFENITLEDRGEYHRNISNYNPDFEGKGFIGVGTIGASEFIERYSQPVRSADGNRTEAVGNLLDFGMFLPLQTQIMPFHEPLTDVYEVKGTLSFMPPSLFWFLANILYYTFWLNLLVGIFNALPAVPLDGGYPYRDLWDSILKRFRKNKTAKEREESVNRITVYTALFILVLLMWTLIVPYLK